MASPLERMIDAAVLCLCCGSKGVGTCGCAEAGVWCGVCHKCADHCDGTTSCDDWWIALQEELDAMNAKKNGPSC